MSSPFEAPDHFIDQLVDTDPNETAEWQESFDALLKSAGPVRARYIALQIMRRAHEKNVGISGLRTTDYINTIPSAGEPNFPGGEAMDRRIAAVVRWNAAVMVHRAQHHGVGAAGPIAPVASPAPLDEVGVNPCFTCTHHRGGGEQVRAHRRAGH